jgi:LuxR family transcriptional regulator, maltose regulon positive regulatory protein
MADLEDLSIARVLLARREPAAVVAMLQPLNERARDSGQWRNVMEARMLLALAHSMLGETDVALCDLHAALTLAASEGFLRVFLDESDPLADLLATYLASEIASNATAAREREHARTVLAAFGRVVEAASPAPADLLSPREVDVLRLLATGRSNEAIASDLVVALSTIKWHVAHIYRKLGVRGRMQAVARGRELRLIA